MKFDRETVERLADQQPTADEFERGDEFAAALITLQENGAKVSAFTVPLGPSLLYVQPKSPILRHEVAEHDPRAFSHVSEPFVVVNLRAVDQNGRHPALRSSNAIYPTYAKSPDFYTSREGDGTELSTPVELRQRRHAYEYEFDLGHHVLAMIDIKIG